MRLSTRKLLDRSFTGVGLFSLVLMCGALLILLVPIIAGGIRAVVFRQTVEWRRFMLEHWERGDRSAVQQEVAETQKLRRPVYRRLDEYERGLWGSLAALVEGSAVPTDIRQMIEERTEDLPTALERYKIALMVQRQPLPDELEQLEDKVGGLREVRKQLINLFGALPGQEVETARKQYGDTRWDRAQAHLERLLYRTEYDYSDPDAMGKEVLVPRVEQYRGTPLEPLFGYCEENLAEMLNPRWCFYWRFWFDESYDDYFFGGIGTEVLGTLYITFGAVLVAGPVGLITAIYLAEYAGRGRFISLIRTCISTLAGVPSVVFGLFGLIFFIDTIGVSDGSSVAAGCLTLAVLILPTIIRASEEAIKAVPITYKEASLSLGATRWKTIVKVILPAALPGVITSVIISMGRAAGETAPLLFTAAAAAGSPVLPWELFSKRTPVLSANIYSITAEHAELHEIMHVPYGMVLTLIVLVLMLNAVAIWLRARISGRLRG